MYIKVSAKNREKESSHLLKGCEQSNEPAKFIWGIYICRCFSAFGKIQELRFE